MARQTNNIVSFDEARRATEARRSAAPSRSREADAPRSGATRTGSARTSASRQSRAAASAGRSAQRPATPYRSAIYDNRSYQEDLRREQQRADGRRASRGESSHAEEADQSFESFFGKMGERAQKAKRQAAKAKADREFAKNYVDHSASAADPGPRAAVYRGEMGSQHRRASRMQNEASASGSSGMSMPGVGVPKLVRKPAVIVSMAVACCLLFCCVFLYAPAQQYYLELRDRDRLAVEYEAVSARNEAIAEEVKILSTPEGIQDRAREEFGWIAEGEYAVDVKGLSSAGEPVNIQANVNAASIKAPDTWYSGFLDSFFGYE